MHLRKLPILAALAISFSAAQSQEIEGSVNYMTVANGKLLIGGDFEKSDRRIVNNVTTFDGTKFAGLAKGVHGGVRCIAADGKNIYVAGNFYRVNVNNDDEGGMESNQIAWWDGTQWKSFGEATVDRQVHTALVRDGKLYIGGDFQKVAGKIETSGVAMWDGKKWSDVAKAQFDRTVLSLCATKDYIYAAGYFTINGDEPMEGFAKFDGKTWTEAGERGLEGAKVLATDGTNVYIGGEFEKKSASGKTLRNIAIWNGKEYLPMAGGLNGNVQNIFVDGSKVYVAGQFTLADNGGKKPIDAYGVAMWDGTKWTGFPEVRNASFWSVAVYNGVLYAGGNFEGAFPGICKWENGKWTKVLNP